MHKIAIYCWHGRTMKLMDKICKLFPNSSFDEEDRTYILNDKMSLDEFYRLWDDKVMILPRPTEGDILIGVTEHSNFGQR